MENLHKSPDEIKAYMLTKADYNDFTKFEDKLDPYSRKTAKENFINNIDYVPQYEYPSLDDLNFDEKITEMKTNLYEAVLELEAAKDNKLNDESELEIYASFLELRLKKIMLTEAARNLNFTSNIDLETNKDAFSKINAEVYGEFSENIFNSILNDQLKKINGFEAKNQTAENIKSELVDAFGEDFDEKESTELLDKESMKKFNKFLLDRYSDVLGSVPDTDEKKYYNSEECVNIFNNAIKTSGLMDKGWKAEVNSSKLNVATNTGKKTIYIPESTSRNSNELKRLIIHELEVHARRYENGLKTDKKYLRGGTADYADAEEGLAVMMECGIEGNFDNASYERAKNRYLLAGLAMGINGEPKDARESYEQMWRIIAINDCKNGEINIDNVNKSKEKAYTLVENAFRGTPFWMKGVIYTKLKVYYEGLVKNAEFIKQHIDNLDDIFDKIMIGKYNHTDEKETELIFNSLIEERE